MILIILQQLLVLFLLAGVGFVLKKRRVLNDTVDRGFSAILMNIALPCTVLTASRVELQGSLAGNLLQTLIIAVAFHVVSILFMILVAKAMRVQGPRRVTLISVVVFANMGSLGFPLAQALLGQEGVLYTSIFQLVFFAFLYTFGISLYSNTGRFDLRRAILNPVSVSVLVTLALLFLKIRLPFILDETVSRLSGLTTPMAMMILGSLLGNLEIKKLFVEKMAFVLTGLRLLVIPTVTILVMYAFHVEPHVALMCGLLSGSASASLNVTFALVFDCDIEFNARSVFLSMLFIIVTMPLLLLLLTRLFPI